MSELIVRGHSGISADKAYAGLMYPDDVVAAPDLTTAEKRAILASWASDERAVVGDPTRRQLPCGTTVRLREITRALEALDRRTNARFDEERGPRWSSDRRRRVARWFARRGPRPDDEDDPPPVRSAMRLPLAPAA